MKKLITMLALAIAGISTSLVYAQVPPHKPEAKTEVKSKEVVHLKKDGTPDKRYKENKVVVKHVTKEGKPDMRYKENKKVTPTKTKVVEKKKM